MFVRSYRLSSLIATSRLTGGGQGPIIVMLLAVCGMLSGVSFGQTLSPRKVLGRYQQQVWQDQHGLPQNSINAIARTRDGYLWLGTFEGAVRFDGVHFTVFDNITTGVFGSNSIISLLTDREGRLWVGTLSGGLTCLADGRFTRYTTKDGLSNDYVQCLLEGRGGELWVGTENGLNCFRDGRFATYTVKDGLPHNKIWALTEDHEGALWVGTENGLASLKDGRFTAYSMRDGLPVNDVRALYFDRLDTLWVGTTRGLGQFKGGRFTAYGDKKSLAGLAVRALCEDRRGALWIGTESQGLYRIEGGRFDAYTSREGLPGDRVTTIYEDPEGDLWVGTDATGLCQLREGRFQVYTEEDGLADDFVRAIYEDRSGNLWLSTTRGLSRFKDGAFTSYAGPDGRPIHTNTLSDDSQGGLWFSDGNRLCRLDGNRFTTWTDRDGLADSNIFALHYDHSDTLWVATYGGGLGRLRDGHFTFYTTRDGLPNDNIISLYEDRAGAIWVGTMSGFSRMQDGRLTTWTTGDGMTVDPVISFYEDRDGGLWVGTHGGGLIRFKDGKFVTITSRDGLYDNLAFQILEDDNGDLWMSGNRGIYRANLKELNDFADGRISRVNSFAYGVADGMLSRECNGANPAGWKTRDGRLWFATVKGAVVIDPRRYNTEPPLVAIEQATLDREILPAGESVRIRPGQGNLEIHYTGLSWQRPQQIKFKYQLVGLDAEWVDAGERRTAYYSHLPPGEYTFKVIADNGEGVWNLEGKSLRITVLPPFYRTWWFVTLAALAAAGLIAMAWTYRVAQLTRAQAVQQAFSRQLIESQEGERKRIAAELHDSLGQTLLIIKNRAFLGTRVTENGGSSSTQLETANEQFDEISSAAAEAINEVRAIAYHLRPSQLERLGLTMSIEEMIEQVAEASGIRFDCEIASLDRVFSSESEINFYRIVQESLNNIVKHSDATQVRIRIRSHGRGVELIIQDNGKGFEPSAARANGSRKPGLGLISIAERARILGGTHQIESVPGRGTTVTVNIETPKG